MKKELEQINFTRIPRDVNGNPRLVCHFVNMQKSGEHLTYAQAVKRANKIGGRKYNTKSYGGGIVFQSYSEIKLNREISELLKNL